MYLKRITFENYGPISNASIATRFSEDGKPVPIAIVGVNGSGKSLVLSVLLDAFVSLRERIYQPGADVRAGKLFKPIKRSISSPSSKFTYALAEFKIGESEILFSEIISHAKTEEGYQLPEEFDKPAGFDNKRFKNNGLSKTLSPVSEEQLDQVRECPLAFYPPGRAEAPGWLSEDVNVDFETSPMYLESPGYSVWRTQLVDEVTQWVLDVVLDCELYDRTSLPVTLGQSGKTVMATLPNPSGKNRKILSHLNTILTEIVKNGPGDFESARFAVSERNAGRRAVIIQAKRADGTETVLANQIRDLSTGELMVLCLFADVVRIAEIDGWNREKIEDIEGMVLIDEIDLHLHIKLQRELVPKLIRMMPSVQFIFTTHSPFLSLGISDGEVDIVNMPRGVQINVDEFSEFGEAYDTFIQKNERYRTELSKMREKLARGGRPLVVTEGKTDWRHLKNALERFQAEGDYHEVDVDFFEVDSDMGDAELEKCFWTFLKVPPNRPMICIFDRDNAKIVRRIAETENGFQLAEGAPVAAMCLEVPSHRDATPEICVEHLYTDEVLSTCIPGTSKRLRFFHEIGYKSDKKTAYLRNTPDAPSIRIFDQDVTKVGMEDGTEQGEVAISKNVFLKEIVLGPPGASFDLSGFRPTLDRLRKIVEIVKQE